MSSNAESLLFELIRKDHSDLRSRVAALESSDNTVESGATRAALREAIEHHLAMEERVLYPALGKIEAITSFMDRMRAQHELIREANAADDLLADLRARLEEHFEEEEARLFDYAAQYLSGELEMLATELEDSRNAERGAYGVG